MHRSSTLSGSGGRDPGSDSVGGPGSGEGRRPYPVWSDNLWLSIFVLDLAGNHFDWYDRYRHFDAIPHAHGTGAATVALAELLDLPLVEIGRQFGGRDHSTVIHSVQKVEQEMTTNEGFRQKVDRLRVEFADVPPPF